MVECPICMENKLILKKWPTCQHYFCQPCIHTWISCNNNCGCPVCRASGGYYFLFINTLNKVITFLRVDFPKHWELFSDFMIEQGIIL